ncbi:MAG TPA: hypothetical protein VE733_20030 [Streptosporangiaceae bacterium]|nr:hypothetical protein [Streptosporangiaceae bacterium]
MQSKIVWSSQGQAATYVQHQDAFFRAHLAAQGSPGASGAPSPGPLALFRLTHRVSSSWHQPGKGWGATLQDGGGVQAVHDPPGGIAAYLRLPLSRT